MRIIETRVRPKTDRASLEEEFLEAMGGGAGVLFALVDKPNAKVSGASRLAREFKGRFSGAQSYRGKTLFSNYFSSLDSATDADVQTLIRGLGTRFPCEHGWVLLASSLSSFRNHFGKDCPRLDQNSFLPDQCVVFSFGVFGALALTVRVLEDFAPEGNLQGKEWRHFHQVLSPDEVEQTRRAVASVSTELDLALDALNRSVTKSGSAIATGHTSGGRVTLSPVAKTHFKRLGYRWNKALSEPRVTIFDKLTSGGNIIRVSADAGGHADLIPYVDAQFISTTYRSASVPVVNPCPVTSRDQLVSLLSQYEPHLRQFEERVAGHLDAAFPQMDEALQSLLLQEDVRAIVHPPKSLT
jgi:hypothetical protein